jgi:hypothetical protein
MFTETNSRSKHIYIVLFNSTVKKILLLDLLINVLSVRQFHGSELLFIFFLLCCFPFFSVRDFSAIYLGYRNTVSKGLWLRQR